MKLAKGLFWSFMVLLFLCLGGLYAINSWPLLSHTVLEGSTESNGTFEIDFYRGKRPQGVIIVTDHYDRIASLNIAREFSSAGLHVAMFDTNGENASKEVIAQRIQGAADAISDLTHLKPEEVSVMAFGESVQGAMELIAQKNPGYGSLAFISPGFSISRNVSSNAYTFTEDDQRDLTDRFLAAGYTGKILVLGSNEDEHGAVESQTWFYNILSGDTINKTGSTFQAAKNNVTLNVVSAVIAPFQIYSHTIYDAVKQWYTVELRMTGTNSDAFLSLIVPFLWVGFAGSLMIVLMSVSFTSSRKYLDTLYSVLSVKFTGVYRFLGVKILLWLAALIPAAAIYWLLSLLPHQVSNVSVFLIALLSANGLISFVLLRIGKMPFVDGDLTIPRRKISPARIIAGICVFLFFTALLAAFFYTGLYNPLDLLRELPMVIAAILLTSGWFFMTSYDFLILQSEKCAPGIKLLYLLISLLPMVLIQLLNLVFPVNGIAMICLWNAAAFLGAVLIGKAVRYISSSSIFETVAASLWLMLIVCAAPILK